MRVPSVDGRACAILLSRPSACYIASDTERHRVHLPRGPPRAAAATTPDREALVTADERLTFADLLARSQRSPPARSRAGIRHGDRVAIWAPNGVDWAVAALGLTGIGAILVPVNTRFKGEEARYLLDRTAVTALVVDDAFLSELLGSDPVEALGNPEVRVIRLSDTSAFLEAGQAISAGELETRAGKVDAADISDIIFTSGTTGRPKGAVITHGQSVRLFQNWADTVGLQDGDRMLVVAPFFHTFGYKAGLLACLLKRATAVPLKVFDVDVALSTIARSGSTSCPDRRRSTARCWSTRRGLARTCRRCGWP